MKRAKYANGSDALHARWSPSFAMQYDKEALPMKRGAWILNFGAGRLKPAAMFVASLTRRVTVAAGL